MVVHLTYAPLPLIEAPDIADIWCFEELVSTQELSMFCLAHVYQCVHVCMEI